MMVSVSVDQPVHFGDVFTPRVELPKGKRPDGGYWLRGSAKIPDGSIGWTSTCRVGESLQTGTTPSWPSPSEAEVTVQLLRIDGGNHKDVAGAAATFHLLYP